MLGNEPLLFFIFSIIMLLVSLLASISFKARAREERNPAYVFGGIIFSTFALYMGVFALVSVLKLLEVI